MDASLGTWILGPGYVDPGVKSMNRGPSVGNLGMGVEVQDLAIVDPGAHVYIPAYPCPSH